MMNMNPEAGEILGRMPSVLEFGMILFQFGRSWHIFQHSNLYLGYTMLLQTYFSALAKGYGDRFGVIHCIIIKEFNPDEDYGTI